LNTNALSDPKICELMILSPDQREAVIELVAINKQKIQEINYSLEELEKRYLDLFNHVDRNELDIQNIIKKITLQRNQIDYIKMRELVDIHFDILSNDQQDLMPTCKFKMESYIESN